MPQCAYCHQEIEQRHFDLWSLTTEGPGELLTDCPARDIGAVSPTGTPIYGLHQPAEVAPRPTFQPTETEEI